MASANSATSRTKAVTNNETTNTATGTAKQRQPITQEDENKISPISSPSSNNQAFSCKVCPFFGFGEIDFEGQRLSEQLYLIIITVSWLVGLVLGFILHSWKYLFITWGVGFVLACALCIPPWPMYRRQQGLKWQSKIKQQNKID